MLENRRSYGDSPTWHYRLLVLLERAERRMIPGRRGFWVVVGCLLTAVAVLVESIVLLIIGSFV